MRILHYSLGIYPDRQGGLVRYSTDLAMAQSKDNTVYYLMPGKLGIIDKKVSIVRCNSKNAVIVYRIDNALPIPMFSGIKDINTYTRSVDQGIYESFLSEKKIEVIHIHSLMGLHVELLRAAKRMGIPVFLSTHDFFGLCPITTLYINGRVCENKCISENCYLCSEYAHSYIKLAIGQSYIYKRLKGASIISDIRKKVLSVEADDNKESKIGDEKVNSFVSDYLKLNNYYRECFSLISIFLFNSNQTKEVFVARLGTISGITLPLLLPTIVDKRKKREFFKDEVCHISFMGECKSFKGYYLLREAIKELFDEGHAVELDVYNDSAIESDFVRRMGAYTTEKLDSIYENTDIVVVPSIWYETFSFVTLEAIARSMPCIVSDHVGAKDYIINKETGYIVKAGAKEDLKRCLRDILRNKDMLSRINLNICKQNLNFSFKEHCNSVMREYTSVQLLERQQDEDSNSI